MADDPIVDEPVVDEPVVDTPADDTPHPLAPGGPRFEEVYARMKAAEDREREKDARLARLEGAVQQRQPQQPQQYTSEQIASYLQTQVDQGQITPMAAANALSQFNAQQAATRTAMQVEGYRVQANKLQAAGAEVNAYMDRVPALRDTNSADFIKVRDAAYEASEDMGLPVTDLRVQRVALKQVYGSLSKMAKVEGDREQSRRASLPHVETTTNGGNRAPAKGGDTAWKEGIPDKQMKYWKERGYTEQQMKDEARYVKRRA